MRIASPRRTRMPVRGPAALSVMLAFGLLLALGTAPLSAAAVTDTAEGERIPLEVSSYIERHLVQRLTELYAPAADGTGGIAFNETTQLGTTRRVSEWSPAFLAHDSAEPPTRLRNDWVVPVTLDDSPVGVATVWINPASNDAELADFTPDAALADAIAGAAGAGVLVHDGRHSAWFALADDTVTPLAPGTSSIDGPVSVTDAQSVLTASVPEQQAEGPNVPLLTAVLLLLVIVGLTIFVMLPSRRRPADAAPTTVPAVASAGDLRGEHPIA